MKKRTSAIYALVMVGMLLLFKVSISSATAISITNGLGAVDYIIGTSETGAFDLNPNNNDDSILYLWDEVQNYTLTQNMWVDRVADLNASYVGVDQTTGNYFIREGTIVSSHYVQWDPLDYDPVEATLNFDSEIFALITSDINLFNSDFLGRPGINYGDFHLRGLEQRDTTIFNNGSVDINWRASNPGDWTRLVTAYSPGANPAPVPEPATIFLLGTGLVSLAGMSRKKFIKK